uniref:MATE family efflux transporter n=1 Tax=Agathobacter sp. TaxID=2021311 RepID=UPI004056A5C2
MSFIKKIVGNREFYKMVLGVVIPIMIQNAVTSFVGLLDNIMVGQLGTNPMSGVSIVNQILNVFYLCIFGAVSGAGLFTAQFYGKDDQEGIRYTIRFKLIATVLITIIWLVVLLMIQEPLIKVFLNDTDASSVSETLNYAKQYLAVMILGLAPLGITQVYASTLRETGETVVPMLASVSAVVVNLCLNIPLIFGLWGFPKLGIVGAAIATVTARFVEVGIVISWAHSHKQKFPFVEHMYHSLYIPKELIKQMIVKASPLLLNETLWAAGMATLVQCYSTRGLDVIAAFNISNTINSLFSVGLIAFGSAIGIIVGHQLGAGEIEKAVDTDRKLIAFSVAGCGVMGLVMLTFSSLFPAIYNTTDEVKSLAATLIICQALLMPLHAYYNATYFTLRSGGKTFITFLFDSGCIWAINIPVAFCLSRFTALPVVPMFLIVEFINIWKCVLGTYLVAKRVWVNNMVKEF